MDECENLVRALLPSIKSLDETRRQAEKILIWTKKNQTLILFPDSFPTLLKQINHPPRCLFFQGNPEVLEKKFISVVGARRASPYGLACAFRLSRELAAGGVGIISGLAKGIDGASHQGALNAGGTTLAVMGCGFDSIYPRENKRLAFRILDQGGGWLSEYPPFVPPLPQHFPQRNRLISALGVGCLVIEAQKKSGSLITALFALEQGKEIFVVPGPIDSPHFEGAHYLIQQGAKLVFCVKDIVEELPLNSFFYRQKNSEDPHPFLFGERFTLGQWNLQFPNQSARKLLCAIEKGDILEVAPQRYLSTLPNPN